MSAAIIAATAMQRVRDMADLAKAASGAAERINIPKALRHDRGLRDQVQAMARAIAASADLVLPEIQRLADCAGVAADVLREEEDG